MTIVLTQRLLSWRWGVCWPQSCSPLPPPPPLSRTHLGGPCKTGQGTDVSLCHVMHVSSQIVLSPCGVVLTTANLTSTPIPPLMCGCGINLDIVVLVLSSCLQFACQCNGN